MNRGLLAGLLVLLLGAGIFAWLHDWRSQDLDEQGNFAKVLVIKNGKGWLRTGAAGLPDASQETVESHSAKPIEVGTGIPPESRIDIEPNSELRVETTGGWILLLKEGRYFLLDARRDEKAGVRWLKILVDHGSLRAKAQDYQAEEQQLEVKAADARVYVVEGQIGMRVLPGGAGQTWLISGDATLERAGKDSLKMVPKKVEEL